jgi:group I intron endonuclease
MHANPHLQNAYNKYGSLSFQISIIEECDQDNLLKREQYYIDLLTPAYNITKEVINNRLSPESRLKISNTLKEKVKNGIITYPLNVDKQKEVIVYDSNCKCIEKFLSQRAAGRYLKSIYPKFSPKTVSMLVNKKGKNKRGRYKNNFVLYPEDICVKDIIRSDAFKISCYDTQYDRSIIFNKTDDLAKFIGCSASAVFAALKNNRLLFKRFKLTKL